MFKTYQETTQCCDHIGCIQDAQFSVESEATRSFKTVCYEHAHTYGSATWSRDYNNVQYTSEKPSRTILSNDVPRPFFSETEIKLNII